MVDLGLFPNGRDLLSIKTSFVSNLPYLSGLALILGQFLVNFIRVWWGPNLSICYE